MKKITALLLATFILVISITSCKPSNNDNSEILSFTSIQSQESSSIDNSKSFSESKSENSSVNDSSSTSSSHHSNPNSSISNSKVSSIALSSSSVSIVSTPIDPIVTNPELDIMLEAEDYYEKTTDITTNNTGNYLVVDELNHSGETNDSFDESIRFQPVDFRDGYKSISIRYAHETTDFSLSMDVYNTNGSFIINVPLPSTGDMYTFKTTSFNLPSTLNGRKDLTFIFKDFGANLSYINIDWISFTQPVARTINKNKVNYSLFDTGMPDISGYQNSAQIKISGDGDRIIENMKFFPTHSKYAIEISNHKTGTIIIRNCYFGGINPAAVDGLNPGNGRGILVMNSSNVLIENNYFDRIQEYGIWCEATGSNKSNNLVVANNKFLNMQGEYYPGSSWGYQSKCVQFFNINGIENKIWYNRCLNMPGISFMCDFINVYISGGKDVTNPTKVYYNAFIGGADKGTYNLWGGAIQLGDHSADNDAGQYLYGKYNRIVYPGMAGMNINGGYKMAMMHNYIYSSGSLRFIDVKNVFSKTVPWTALCLYNYSAGISRDSGHRIIDNHTYFEGQGDAAQFVNWTHPKDTTITTKYHGVEMWPLDILPYDFMK